jgi:dihydrodipicolinate synthase/N-acetylneuraminate lyase
MLLYGIFPPITTPFYPDGNVYFKKLEANVERYSKTPVAGIVALGSTGEAIMLSDQERRDVLKTTREATAPHKVLNGATTSRWCARRIFTSSRCSPQACWPFTASWRTAHRCR